VPAELVQIRSALRYAAATDAVVRRSCGLCCRDGSALRLLACTSCTTGRGLDFAPRGSSGRANVARLEQGEVYASLALHCISWFTVCCGERG